MKYILLIAALLVGGCSSLTSVLSSAVGGGTPAVQANLTAGQNVNQGLEMKGDTQEVDADTIGVVKGTETNQRAETIVNEVIPNWVIVALVVQSIMNIVFLCLPTPTQMRRSWKSWRNR